jgi:hypothetical protein
VSDRDSRIAKIVARVTIAPDETVFGEGPSLKDFETLIRSHDNIKEMKKWHEDSRKKEEWKPKA